MIPLKLTVRNFMPYRDNVPTLSFEGIHVACLIGDNGHGKSALFDAMTWALWGRSRAKSDDELIHIGQPDMSVDFEFGISDQRYRVLRKLTKAGPGRSAQGSLDLFTDAAGAYRLISGNTQKETQDKLTGLLHMDYDTFINSAFLVQGHADEFTGKPAGQRKEVLASILDLSHYDELADRARSTAAERKLAADTLAAAIADIETQSSPRQEDEARLTGLKPRLAQLEEAITGQEAGLAGLRRDNEALARHKSTLAEVETGLNQARREAESWRRRSAESRARIAQFQKLLADRPGIVNGFQRLGELRKTNDEFTRKLSGLRTLERRQAELDKAIQEAGRGLMVKHELALQAITEAGARLARLPEMDAELGRLWAGLAGLTGREDALKTNRAAAKALHGQITSLESTIRQLEEDARLAGEKLELLSRGADHCPLCEQILGLEGRQRVEAKLKAEAQTKGAEIRAKQTELARKRKELASLERDLTQAEANLLRERTIGQSKVDRLEKDIAETRGLDQRSLELKAELQSIEERLARKEYAREAQEAILGLQQEIRGLQYDESAHGDVRRQLAGHQHFEVLNQQLTEAARGLAEQEAGLAAAGEAADALESRIASDEAKAVSLRAACTGLAGVADKLREAEAGLRQLHDEERGLRDLVSSLEERVRRYVELEKNRQEKQTAWRFASEEAGIYTELATAFGKKGVQGLLVEQAIPEVQDEANRLLGKMTDGRMALALQTQRGKKSGKGVIETLDIKVADELGTRNYEMFSGGEAFRINLALRIALSRLLVRRAGAALPTLIIDEGFGTQDTSGRDKLVEAINSIQNDFEKIFVITHLEELKDAFPVRIVVTKTDQGSMVEVQ